MEQINSHLEKIKKYLEVFLKDNVTMYIVYFQKKKKKKIQATILASQQQISTSQLFWTLQQHLDWLEPGRWISDIFAIILICVLCLLCLFY